MPAFTAHTPACTTCCLCLPATTTFLPCIYTVVHPPHTHTHHHTTHTATTHTRTPLPAHLPTHTCLHHHTPSPHTAHHTHCPYHTTCLPRTHTTHPTPTTPCPALPTTRTPPHTPTPDSPDHHTHTPTPHPHRTRTPRLPPPCAARTAQRAATARCNAPRAHSLGLTRAARKRRALCCARARGRCRLLTARDGYAPRRRLLPFPPRCRRVAPRAATRRCLLRTAALRQRHAAAALLHAACARRALLRGRAHRKRYPATAPPLSLLVGTASGLLPALLRCFFRARTRRLLAACARIH